MNFVFGRCKMERHKTKEEGKTYARMKPVDKSFSVHFYFSATHSDEDLCQCQVKDHWLVFLSLKITAFFFQKIYCDVNKFVRMVLPKSMTRTSTNRQKWTNFLWNGKWRRCTRRNILPYVICHLFTLYGTKVVKVLRKTNVWKWLALKITILDIMLFSLNIIYIYSVNTYGIIWKKRDTWHRHFIWSDSQAYGFVQLHAITCQWNQMRREKMCRKNVYVKLIKCPLSWAMQKMKHAGCSHQTQMSTIRLHLYV